MEREFTPLPIDGESRRFQSCGILVRRSRDTGLAVVEDVDVAGKTCIVPVERRRAGDETFEIAVRRGR